MSSKTTRVRVRSNTWERLNRRKQSGESFDDVLTRLLQADDNDNDIE